MTKGGATLPCLGRVLTWQHVAAFPSHLDRRHRPIRRCSPSEARDPELSTVIQALCDAFEQSVGQVHKAGTCGNNDHYHHQCKGKAFAAILPDRQTDNAHTHTCPLTTTHQPMILGCQESGVPNAPMWPAGRKMKASGLARDRMLAPSSVEGGRYKRKAEGCEGLREGLRAVAAAATEGQRSGSQSSKAPVGYRNATMMLNCLQI